MNHCQVSTVNTHRSNFTLWHSVTVIAPSIDFILLSFTRLAYSQLKYTHRFFTHTTRVSTTQNSWKSPKFDPLRSMIAQKSHLTLIPRHHFRTIFITEEHLPANCFFNKSEDCGSDINYNCEIYPDDTKQMIFPQKMAGWVLGRLWNIWVVACFR